jgi:thiol-disulfide isomerase/thioredoxin
MKRGILLLFVSIILLAAGSQAQGVQRVKITDVEQYIADNKDSVLVINFWATFCKPCNAELPFIHQLVEKYKNQKVKLLLVSIDLPAYFPVKIDDFVKKNKYTAPVVWLDETNADYYCPKIDPKWYGSIPATLFVNNKNGYRKFFEQEFKAPEFELQLKSAIGIN